MPRMIANASRVAATEPHTSLGDDGEAKVILKNSWASNKNIAY